MDTPPDFPVKTRRPSKFTRLMQNICWKLTGKNVRRRNSAPGRLRSPPTLASCATTGSRPEIQHAAFLEALVRMEKLSATMSHPGFTTPSCFEFANSPGCGESQGRLQCITSTTELLTLLAEAEQKAEQTASEPPDTHSQPALASSSASISASESHHNLISTPLLTTESAVCSLRSASCDNEFPKQSRLRQRYQSGEKQPVVMTCGQQQALSSSSTPELAMFWFNGHRPSLVESLRMQRSC
jgi:hypothetical protein